MSSFSHIDHKGRPVMVDVGQKDSTRREAVAEGWVLMSQEVIEKVHSGANSKGDVLKVAEIAGINATKDTQHLIPLCHPISIDHVSLSCSLDLTRGVYIRCTVRAKDVTGVEMEALTGVSVAALTVYDMCKAISKGMEIDGVRLVKKSGGKSGDWSCKASETPPLLENGHGIIKAAVLTVSDKGSRGERVDTSGPLLCEKVTALGASLENSSIVPDDMISIKETLCRWCDEGIELILVTGGTGLSVRDVTPEALMEIADREVPGIGEYMRMKTSVFTERSILSRSLAVTRGESLIIAMPGSEKAVLECFQSISSVIVHAVETLRGDSGDCGRSQ